MDGVISRLDVDVDQRLRERAPTIISPAAPPILYFNGGSSILFRRTRGLGRPVGTAWHFRTALAGTGSTLVLDAVGVGGISADPTTSLTATLTALNPATSISRESETDS